MNFFKRGREMAGFTQKELSEIIGVRDSVISRYEENDPKKRIHPPMDRLRRIADACSLPTAFFTDTEDIYPLNVEQAERFRHEIRDFDKKLKYHPEETKACYGTEHPFLYMLKDRWIPSLEDVEYISTKFGIPSWSILETSLPSLSDASNRLSELFRNKTVDLGTTALRISEEMQKRGYIISLGEAELLAEAGISVIQTADESDLYLKVGGLDPAVIRALLVLTKGHKKTDNPAPSEAEDGTEDK